MAVPFDAERAVVTGDPFLVHESLAVVPSLQGIWDASPGGTLAFAEAPPGSRLVSVDRAGRPTVLTAEIRRFRMPRVSPDGNRIAVQVEAGGGATDIWMFDRRTGSLTRFTTSGNASDAVWTPDGQRVAFAQGRTVDATAVDILWQRADRSTPPESVLVAPGSQWPWSFTPDGKTLVFDELRPQRGGALAIGISAVDIGTSSQPRGVVWTGSADRLGKLSPDGKWLAYTSDEGGRTEVYVRPFPGPGGAAQISNAGGTQPVWSPRRPELFYRDGTHLVAAALELTPEIRVVSRTPLFEDRFNRSNATNYDAMPNGSGFVMLQPPAEAARVIIMANWLPELLRREAEARSR